jgi:phosphoribosylanthranilate isomerase
VKLCGLTRLEDAELGLELGAWALGVIFVPTSPRRCRPADAERIALAARKRAHVAGVFVNATLDELTRLHERIGFDLIQLHGDEGPAYCAAAARRTGARVIKAMGVSTRGDVQALDAFRDVDYHLVDARAPGKRGGTGQTIDVELLGARRSEVPLILAGGLTPDNVAQAAADARPFAVDTASGTEREPGVKDHDRVRAFFAAVAPAPVA